MRLLTTIIIMLMISACTTMGANVTEGSDSYPVAAHAQKSISAAEASKYQAIAACVGSCKVTIADMSEGGEIAAMVAQAAGIKIDLCGCSAIASTGNGRNYFDAKTERTEARVKGAVAGVVALTPVGMAALIVGGYNTASDNQRIQGVSTAENSGDINTAIYASQNNGANSNDPSGGAGGMGSGGTATATTTTSNTSNDTFVIGRTAVNATDDAAINIRGNQMDVAASGNANQQNDDARAGGILTADQNTNSPQDVEDSDGSNNDPNLF